MWKEIKNYQLVWEPKNKRQYAILFFDEGVQYVYPESLLELTALADILRHAKPVHYETQGGGISTGREPVGEGKPR